MSIMTHVRWAVCAAVLIVCPVRLAAQQSVPAHVTIAAMAEGRPLQGAEVRASGRVFITDSLGRATFDLPAGPHRVIAWSPGFSADTIFLPLRAAQDTSIIAALRAMPEALQPIVVRATRTETRVEDQPERVEVLALEDVQEKSLTSPGSLRNLLVEMGGIRVQSVAPGLGGASVRVQGLPGRYTLLLTDGLPLAGGHAPVFSLVQAPPRDLRQVEVIKGAATALYGPMALGGVVDLISKTPSRERDVLLSQGSADGTDAVGWVSRRVSTSFGYTAVAGLHRKAREDVDGDGWADIPGHVRAEARPRLFWNGADGRSLMVTTGGTLEERRGGTLPGAVLPAGSAFQEALDTKHVDFGAVGHLPIGPRAILSVRASGMTTRQDRTFGDWSERDRRSAFFGEATLGVSGTRHSAVAGIAAQYDGFNTRPRREFDYGFTTLSLFASDTWSPASALAIAASARTDRHSRYGTHLSPRLSVLFHPGDRWNIRAALASGFSAPSPADGETQDVGFRYLVPGGLRAERGASASLDVGGAIGPVQMNATLFAERIRDPVRAEDSGPDSLRFRLVNARGPIRSTGGELFAVYAAEPFLVTATYSHTTASEPAGAGTTRVDVPLTPRDAGGIDIAWEEDEPGESGYRAALEVFRTGRQRLEDDPYRTLTPSFTTVELLVSKRIGSVTVFADGENLTNVRQTRWDPLLRTAPGRGGRWTTEEWAPLEGRVLTVGLRAAF